MRARKMRILLVEDSAFDAQLTVEALKDAGVEVDLAVLPDGEKALAYLRGREAHDLPDLVLLDLNLPRKDGREVLAELKACDRLRALPVLVMTTAGSPEDVLEAYRLGANAYVVKPVDYEEFVGVMRSIDAFWIRTVRLPRR